MKTTSRLSDLRVMTDDQLNDEALKLKRERFNLRFQKASGQLQDTARVRIVRRDIARVAPGRIMFEIDGVPESLAREAFSLAAAKLPIKTRFVQRIAE